MTKYQKTKEIIQEANPKIMELKFGCKILEKSTGRITTLFYIHTKGETPYDASYKYLVTPEGSIKEEVFEKDYEIIGRPIRLADVLLAIDYHGQVNLSTDGKTLHISVIGYVFRPDKSVLDIDWNLKDDNFDNQSVETKDFIASLLDK